MGVSWFGNSRGVADGECGEIASGSQEASSGPMPGHNNSLSVAPARFGLSAPGNTQFTQAQNAAFFSSGCLVATAVFALCPQASRAIKKVVRCSRGLPFKGWSLEPSDETQMSRGGVLFPGRGTPAISWQIPKGGEQRLLWAQGKEGGDGAGMGPRVCKGHVHTQAHLSEAGMYTHANLPQTQSQRHVAHTLAHAHTHARLHARAGRQVHKRMGSQTSAPNFSITGTLIYVNPHSLIGAFPSTNVCPYARG